MKVFVYGTLKNGHRNHGWMERAEGEFLFDAVLCGARMYNLGYYPAIAKAPSAEQVFGEVYEVPEAGLTHLDQLEGHPRFYTREEVTVLDQGGASHEVWAYFFHHDLTANDYIPTGVWEKPQPTWRTA